MLFSMLRQCASLLEHTVAVSLEWLHRHWPRDVLLEFEWVYQPPIQVNDAFFSSKLSRFQDSANVVPLFALAILTGPPFRWVRLALYRSERTSA